MTADSKRAVDVKKHDNKWTGGDCDFAWVLPPEQRGSVGCRLVTIVVDPAVGNEVCLLVTEDSEFAVGYASVSPVNLLAHTGLVATPHGPVVFIVWQIAAGSSAEFFLEHFLNPASQSHCDLVEQIVCQTHLKLIIVDNLTSEVIVFVDFANNFAFDELAESMRAVDTPNGENSFGKAVDHVLADFDIVGTVTAAVNQASRPETPI